MSARVLTAGHIRCLEWLTERDFVMVGLLTKKAMKGYKEEVVPYKDRLYILGTIANALEDIFIVPQNSLNPTQNIKEYKCDAIASGDGWEKVELDCISRYNLKRIDIPLPKLYSSSKILKYLDDKRLKK